MVEKSSNYSKFNPSPIIYCSPLKLIINCKAILVFHNLTVPFHLLMIYDVLAGE